MPFCPSCGAPVEGKFCAKCGTPVAGGAAPPPTGTPTPPAPAPQASSGMSPNMAGALAYVLGLITGILFLVLEPYNRNREVRFHAFQSIFFSVSMIIIYIVLMIFGGVLGSVMPLLGHLLTGLVWSLICLGSFVLWVVLIVKTYGGGKMVLPVIGPLAEKQA